MYRCKKCVGCSAMFLNCDYTLFSSPPSSPVVCPPETPHPATVTTPPHQPGPSMSPYINKIVYMNHMNCHEPALNCMLSGNTEHYEMSNNDTNYKCKFLTVVLQYNMGWGGHEVLLGLICLSGYFQKTKITSTNNKASLFKPTYCSQCTVGTLNLHHKKLIVPT